MFFVEARYHESPKRAADQVRDISGREEGLRDGVRRELYGIFVSGCLKRSGREWGRSTAARESPRGGSGPPWAQDGRRINCGPMGRPREGRSTRADLAAAP